MSEVGRITAMIDGDISGLRSAMQQAHSVAVSGVSGIESDVKGKIGSGLSGAISGGDWQSVGKNIGNDLVQNITAPFGAIGNAAGSLATALGPVGIAAVGAAAGIAVLGSASINAAADWQTLMAGVSKTSGLGESGIAELSKQLTDISTKSPIAASELANIAQVAGSLGVGNGLNDTDKAKAIAGFADTASQMSVAFEMPAEEAATRSAKILTAFNQPIDTKNMEALGNTVNKMGDDYAATESQVLDFTNRASYLNTTFGLSVPQVAAWGTTLISAGMESETASTGIKSLMNMSMDPKKFEDFAAAAGMSAEELRDSLNEDVIGTYAMVADKISSGTDAVEKFQTVSKLAGTEGMTTLMKMAGKGDVLQEATGTAQTQYDLGLNGQKGSMAVTFDVQAGTFNSQIQLLSNQASAILRDMGGPILQAINPAIGALASSLGSVRQIGENLWEPMTTALAVPIAAVSGMAEIIGGLGGMTLSGLVSATGAVNSAFQTGKAFVGAFQEEIVKVVTSSSTFQTIAGYVGQVTTAFSNLSSGASDVFDKVVSGLSDAIPTAISGTIGALGTLADKAGLGGLTDAFGGVGEFAGDVYDNAAKKLGWTTEEAVAEGTEKGMEKGAKAAKPSIEDSMEDAALTFGEKLEKLSASKEYSPAVATLVAGGMDVTSALNIAASQASDNSGAQGGSSNVWRVGSTQMMGLDVTYEVSGLGGSGGMRAKLVVNGQEVASKDAAVVSDLYSRDTITSMIADAGISGDLGEAEFLDLEGSTGQAAIIRANQEAQIEAATSLDFTEAETKVMQFNSNLLNEKPTMALQLDMARADEELNRFLTTVITANPYMTVHVQFIPNIDQLTEMAMAAVDQAIVDKYNR